MKRAFTYLLLIVLAIFTMGADQSAAEKGQRFERLGHRIMCTCGCNQILLECNHVGCQVSDGMRNELTAAINKSVEDKPVMDTFIAKYGYTVIAAPMGGGFDNVAWIVPYLTFIVCILLAAYIMRVWKGRNTIAPSAPVAPQQMDALRERARRETETEL
jgi:cytochrome c-type biogenesis protein CcmH